MRAAWDKRIQRLFRLAGLDVKRYTPPSAHARESELLDGVQHLRALSQKAGLTARESFVALCAGRFNQSRAQLFQDLFVLHELDDKPGGYFVEFGATDGVLLSNTWLLEKEHGWQGILAEPARCWHAGLVSNRSAAIDLRCVWHAGGQKITFDERDEAELSAAAAPSDGERHGAKRERGKIYEVETVLLNDLLAEHNAPRVIDYMSIDTEGSEYAILTNFDFTAHDVRIITVEHNHTASRQDLYTLLNANGYRRKFEEFSHWDDWYVKG
jgi:FkbM family methyltransferase